MEFKVNDTFTSYAELQRKVEAYCKKNHADLHKRDARTLKSAVKQKKISEERAQKENLLYYEVKYACIHGGRKTYTPRGEGKRKTATFQCGCPFLIALRLSEDGQCLIVKEVVDRHENHSTDIEEYNYLPKSRKLSDAEVSYVTDMISLGANKKKLQQQIFGATGKHVILKDLSNIQSKLKREKHSTKNDLSACVDQLRNTYSCTVDICTDAKDTFGGLFVQDERMRRAVAGFPEIVFLDATYKLLELHFPAYLILVEDSNGSAEIAALAVLVTEDAESLGWFIETFKTRNPEVCNTRLVMADKDLNERDVIKEVMPWVKVLICLFHTLKTFRREVTMEKMKITSAMRENCLKLIEKLSYAKSESEYDGFYAQFMSLAPTSVKNYFNSNWHTIREEWVACFKKTTGNFLNATNNRLESINQKLKQVIDKNSSMEFFIENFFILLPVLRNQRNYQGVYQEQKHLVRPYPLGSPEAAYTSLLTSYASSHVLGQLELYSQSTYTFTPGVGGKFSANTSDGSIEVSSLHCTCCWSQSMKLPCRHVFHIRSKMGLPLFDKNLCAERWTTAHSRAQRKAMVAVDNETAYTTEVSVTAMSHEKRLTSQQKYSRAMDVCKKIANTIALSGQESFDHRLAQLQSLSEHWRNGVEVGIQVFQEDALTTDEIGSQDVEDLMMIDAADSHDDRRNSESMTIDILESFDNVPETRIDPLDDMLRRLDEQCSSNLGAHNQGRPDVIDHNIVDAITSSILGVLDGNYDDDIFSFNVNCITHAIDDDIKSTLESMIDQVVDIVGAEGPMPLLGIETNDTSVTITKLKSIKMPPPVKVKGRPKGADKTNVIGTKKASKKNLACQKFAEMRSADKEKYVLSLCIGKIAAEKLLRQGGRLVVEDIDPTEIDNAIYNPLVCLQSVKYLFTTEAWDCFQEFYKNKAQLLQYQCNFCLKSDANEDDLFPCDHCLKYYHFTCVKLKKVVKKRQVWFCGPCKAQEKLCNKERESS